MKTALEYYDTNLGGVTKELLREIKTWLDWIPDATPNVHPAGLWSCHAITRAVKQNWSNVFNDDWKVIDGHFMTSQHCWLSNGGFSRAGLVVDPYPVASAGGPLLIDFGFWHRVYRGDPAFFNEKELREFNTHADLLLLAAQRKLVQERHNA